MFTTVNHCLELEPNLARSHPTLTTSLLGDPCLTVFRTASFDREGARNA